MCGKMQCATRMRRHKPTMVVLGGMVPESAGIFRYPSAVAASLLSRR